LLRGTVKVVCLIRDEPPLRYFANRLQQAHGVDLVVVEDPHLDEPLLERTAAYARAKRPGALTRAVRARARDRLAEARTRTALDEHFGELWRRLDEALPSLRVRSVNDDVVVKHLQELGPAAVLDHGTSLVRDHVLDQAAIALNLHWGLSPYYRGVRCTEWALVLWDPGNIGVTVHRLTREIDGGPIVGQARATVTASDTVHSLNMQLTSLGTEIVVEAVRRLRTGEKISFVEQDLARGMVTSARQWSLLLGRHVARLEREGTLARMLEAPTRAPQPIVSLSSAPTS
jgi:folate-dependent phosphoribosylglycinamide formyltransferase PurN